MTALTDIKASVTTRIASGPSGSITPAKMESVIQDVIDAAGDEDALRYLKAEVEPLTLKGVANGYAALDGGGKIPAAQLPASVIGGVSYQGLWNATTNSPALVSSVGTKGHYYKVSASGSTAINGISDWAIGDWVIFNGTTWDKIDNTDAVTSVAGRTGAVVLTQADVGLAKLLVTGASVASAATLNLDTATGDYVLITGTTSITAVTLADGQRRRVRFAAALTLANGASLILPSGASIVTAAGDTAELQGEASGVVRFVNYFRATGTSLIESSSIVPTGATIYFDGSAAPTGYLKRNGANVSRATYAALFVVLGTRYGVGDGSTTFNVGDFRGEHIRGLDDGRGIDTSRVLGSAQTDSLQNVTGTVNVGSGSRFTAASGAFAISTATSLGATNGSNSGSLVATLDLSTVARTSTETRGRNIALLACIKF